MTTTYPIANTSDSSSLSDKSGIDLREYSRKFLVEFIELYKAHPTLWHVQSREYRNRAKKAAAYQLLIAKCKEVEPDASKYTVVKKINSLRTCYRKELRKIQRTSAGAGVYKPKLWYFHLLSFLDEETLGTSSDSALCMGGDEDLKVGQDQRQNSSGSSQQPQDFLSLETLQQTNQDDLVRPVHSQDSPSDLEASPTSSHDEGKRKPSRKIDVEDEFDLFGKIVAFKMRRLASDQKLYAEKLINDTLFEAEMGNLDRESILGEARTSIVSVKEEEYVSDEG